MREVSRNAALGAAVAALAITLPFAIETLTTIGSESCAVQVSRNCVPFGAEGPAAGTWRYSSKAAYIATGVIPALLPAAAIAWLLKARGQTITLGPASTAVLVALLLAPLLLVLF